MTESNFALLIISKLVQLFLCLPPKVELLSNRNMNEFNPSDGSDMLHLHKLDIETLREIADRTLEARKREA